MTSVISAYGLGRYGSSRAERSVAFAMFALLAKSQLLGERWPVFVPKPLMHTSLGPWFSLLYDTERTRFPAHVCIILILLSPTSSAQRP